MILNNPYYYHPQLAVRQVADDVLYTIQHHPQWSTLFEQGKMLGVLLVEPPSNEEGACIPSRVHTFNNIHYLVAYSGVVNGLENANHYFVPPVYDLQNPDDFYLQKDRAITDINHELASSDSLAPSKVKRLKAERRQLSIALQREIFSHFNFLNPSGIYRNVMDIFADARRGLPPGGTGECAAPRLLQFAYEHRLQPLQIAEFWYGSSPAGIQRIHGHFYPSCIEKCSPILRYMIPSLAEAIPSTPSSTNAENLRVLYDDDYLVAVHKPSGLLSVPAKDLSQPNVETMLHRMYPDVKGPMLVHRLDQATSGILLAAKDAQTFKALNQLFVEKKLQKRYLARLKGKLKSRCGIISLPLSVNPDDRPRQVVDFQFGKEAITYYEIIEAKWGDEPIPADHSEIIEAKWGNESIPTDHSEIIEAKWGDEPIPADHSGIIEAKWGDEPIPADETLVSLYPLTGRTHQLRVHCASPFGLDHPIVGDQLYDILDTTLRKNTDTAQRDTTPPTKTIFPRLMLHATSITFEHPHTKQIITIDARL